jgi:hypothetical protein
MSSETIVAGKRSENRPLCRRILFYQRKKLGQASGGGEKWNSPDPLGA